MGGSASIFCTVRPLSLSVALPRRPPEPVPQRACRRWRTRRRACSPGSKSAGRPRRCSAACAAPPRGISTRVTRPSPWLWPRRDRASSPECGLAPRRRRHVGAQVTALMPAEARGSATFKLQLGPTEFDLYAHSYLGFGQVAGLAGPPRPHP